MAQRLHHFLLALTAALAVAAASWAGSAASIPAFKLDKARASCSCVQARLEGPAVFARVLAQREGARPL